MQMTSAHRDEDKIGDGAAEGAAENFSGLLARQNPTNHGLVFPSKVYTRTLGTCLVAQLSNTRYNN